MKAKTIYEPKGKAGEYAKYAVNFYNGCSNGCEYCYLKRGVLSKTLGCDKPTLQKKYIDEAQAFGLFAEDLFNNEEELKEHGLFFTFSSDPLLEETWGLNIDAITLAIARGVPCTILTKRAEWKRIYSHIPFPNCKLVAVGFTLTGHDEIEPNASPNRERIEAMKHLKAAGFKAWASIEPVVDPESSFIMMRESQSFCDLFKVGLRSGVRYDYYDDFELQDMLSKIDTFIHTPVFLKESVLNRLPEAEKYVKVGRFVTADYSLFHQDKPE